MRVALFVTCLVDLMRPRIGFAAIELLEAAGCDVIVPAGQTCCGQPVWNSGDRAAAAALAKKVIDEFVGSEYVVVPSGSCADQIRNEYPVILADEPEWRARAVELAGRVYELTDFLVNVAHIKTLPGNFSGSVTYHDSCTGLRGMGIKEQPRALLAKMSGVELKEMAAAEECCGFGGTFSVKFGEISAAIAAKKCGNACATGAQTIVGGDLGCLLNIEGKLRRLGDETTQVRHIAEVLTAKK
ncbi:MAG: (Fe-S)-binding protein [Rhodocyclaceae bacterium]|nr:(Fe-S)-binding protein [Rhodocyclaceae bacterium]